METPSGSGDSQDLGLQALLENPASAPRTGPGAWLPERGPEPAIVAEGQFPNSLTADELACLLLNRALDGNIPQVKELAKRLEKMGGVEPAVWRVGAPWNMGYGPLHLAAAYGETEMCKFLIKNLKINPNGFDFYGATPLMFAVKGMENIDVVRLLLIRGANPNMMNCRRYTALHIATSRGNYEIAELLLSGGAVVDPIGDDGETPLHMAAEDGNERIMRLLLRHKPDCNRLIRNLYTPLAMATLGPSLECMNLLIQAGADVNKHVTPLILAAANGKADRVKCLLYAGADANSPDKIGEVPIIAAAKEGYVHCVEILFPYTTPLDEVEDWSVQGIIHCALNVRKFVQDVPREELGRVLKAQGDAYLRRGEYAKASCLYTMINYNKAVDPNDSDLYAKRCLCWLHMRDKQRALDDAIIYKSMKPGSSQSRYLEGAALLLAKHDRALETLLSGLDLDFGGDLIKKGIVKKKKIKKEASTSREANPDA